MTTLRAPATCIPDLTVSFDVNRDWPCKRAQFIASLHNFVRDVKRTERRASHAYGEEQAHLIAWVADAEQRYARLLLHLDAKQCTCWQSGLYGCPWCHDVDTDPIAPAAELCDYHAAEWEGLSLAELERREAVQSAEVADLYG